MKKTKAVFLDRDGVINIEKNYLHKIEDFEFIDGVFEACKYFQDQGFIVVVITNQSGIGRGYYTQEDFDKLTVWMVDQFKQNGIDISKVLCCPHTPDYGCGCRKPNTKMIDDANSELNIDLEKSWIIGDKSSDIQCGLNSGIKNTIQVKSGHKFDEKSSKALFVLPTIKESIGIVKQN